MSVKVAEKVAEKDLESYITTGRKASYVEADAIAGSNFECFKEHCNANIVLIY